MNRADLPESHENTDAVPEYRMAGDQIARTIVAEFIPGRGFFGTLGVIILLLLAGLIFLFYHAKDQLFTRENYLLTRKMTDPDGDWFTVDKIRFLQQTPDGLSTDVPPWLEYDIRYDVLRLMSDSGELKQLSILEPSLVEHMHNALTAHPWVRSVTRIQKFRPARMDVVLEYRKPVMMVQRRDPQTKQVTAVVPMDVDLRVLKKSDIPEAYRNALPVLKDCDFGMVSTAPGAIWNDVIVQEAAKIVTDFGSDWQKLNLHTIRPVQIEKPNNQFVYHFFLDTRTGGTVDFDPMSTPAEPYSTARTRIKVDALVDYLLKHKTLDTPDGKPLGFKPPAEPQS